MQSVSSQALIDRMMGAARLDSATFEEVEHDTNATSQALIVVVLAAVAGGIGAIRNDGISGLIGGTISGIVGWVVFSAFIFFVGTRFLKTSETEADMGQVLRTLGFADSPGILAIVGIIPILGPIVAAIASLWVLVASIIGVRQALEMSTGRAIATIIIAAIAEAIVVVILAAIFGIAFFGLG
jgi:hypothetical protein